MSCTCQGDCVPRSLVERAADWIGHAPDRTEDDCLACRLRELIP